MHLRRRLVGVPFDARFASDPGKNVLYLNFEHLEVRTAALVGAIGAKVRAICEPVVERTGHRGQAVVNYEGFVLDADLEDRYAEMAGECVRRWYAGDTRFTTSAFMRAKLGDALSRRRLSPSIFESEREALRNLAAMRRDA